MYPNPKQLERDREAAGLASATRQIYKRQRDTIHTLALASFLLGFTFGTCITWLAILKWSPLCV